MNWLEQYYYYMGQRWAKMDIKVPPTRLVPSVDGEPSQEYKWWLEGYFDYIEGNRKI